jgi:hypothetical protein
VPAPGSDSRPVPLELEEALAAIPQSLEYEPVRLGACRVGG